MTTQLIPVVPATIGHQTVQTVDGRTLHTFLEVQTEFSKWMDRRIEEYGFIEEQDFSSFLAKTPQGGRPSDDDRNARMTPLAYRPRPAYADPVPCRSKGGNDSPKSSRRASAIRRRFFHACFSHGGLRGETSRSAGVLLGRSVNPALIRHHLFDSSVGGLQILVGVPL